MIGTMRMIERSKSATVATLALAFLTWSWPAGAGESVVTYIDDGHAVIVYPGGRYEGGIQGRVAEGPPVWHGPCTFYFVNGARFEGVCENGEFVRGFLFSRDGRSAHFFGHRNAVNRVAAQGDNI